EGRVPAGDRHLVLAPLDRLNDSLGDELRGIPAAAIGLRLTALVPDLGVDRAGMNQSHMDTRATKIIPKPLRESVERAFGRRIHRFVGRDNLGCERGNVDNGTTALAEHGWNRGKRCPET